MGGGQVVVAPIGAGDLAEVGDFLHKTLNQRISAAEWAKRAQPSWGAADAPNHGFLLRDGGDVVGVYLAFYSERVIHGQSHRICNQAAWSVVESHRMHAVRLARALVKQPDFEFTDFSPSGSVVSINERLGFRRLDTTTFLVFNAPFVGATGGADVITGDRAVSASLGDSELVLFEDHRTAGAALQFVVAEGDRSCLVVARRDRRRGLPIFASILYVSDQELFQRHAGLVFRHLLLRERALATLVEPRVTGAKPRRGVLVKRARAKMFRSNCLVDADVDYLYSELTNVAW